MTLKTRDELKMRFQKDARPSEQDFKDLIVSTLNKRDDRFMGSWRAGSAYKKGDVVIHARTFWELAAEEICSESQNPPSKDNKDWHLLLVPAADEDWVLVDQKTQSRSRTERDRPASDRGPGTESVPATMHANPRVTRVGIGTTKPMALLDLLAAERVRLLLGGGDQDHCLMRLINLSLGSGQRQLAVGINEDAVVLVTDSDRGFVFRASGKSAAQEEQHDADRGRILLGVPSAGDANLGVGRRPQDYQLDVHGLSRLHGVFIATDHGNITGDKPLGSVLDQLVQLRPVTFEWDTATGLEANGEQIGLVAQDVCDVFPQAVKADGDDSVAVSNHALVAVLVKAVQEQQEHIQNLETRLSSLEQRFSDRDSTPESCES